MFEFLNLCKILKDFIECKYKYRIENPNISEKVEMVNFEFEKRRERI